MRTWPIAVAGLLACTTPPDHRPRAIPPAVPPPTPTVVASAEPAAAPTPRPTLAAADAWPVQPEATWPPGCLIYRATMHPTRPWLAVACGLDVTADEERGAVVVIDVDEARVRSVTPFDVGVCAFDDPLLWHPDGTRLAVNVDTNGIAILERGERVLLATPDELRDHGFEMLWRDDRLLVDLGGYLSPDGLEAIDGALPMFRMAWNEATQAVVGFDGRKLRSYEPATGRTRYDLALGNETSSYACGPLGRRCVVQLSEPRSQNGRRLQPLNRLRVFDGDDGTVITELEGSLPQLGLVAWARDGRFAVHSYDYRKLGRRWGVAADHVDVITAEGDRIAVTIDLGTARVMRGRGSPSEARRMAFTRDGGHLGILLEGGDVVVADPGDGRVLHRFSAPPAPVPAWMTSHPRWRNYGGRLQMGGLIATDDRWVRIYDHGLSLWSLEGDLLAQWTADRATR